MVKFSVFCSFDFFQFILCLNFNPKHGINKEDFPTSLPLKIVRADKCRPGVVNHKKMLNEDLLIVGFILNQVGVHVHFTLWDR